MPDPNQNQNQNPGDSNQQNSAVPNQPVADNPVSIPTLPPTTDLPSITPDPQDSSVFIPTSTENTTPTPLTTPTLDPIGQTTQGDSGSASPSDIPPVVAPGGKKKFGGGRIIATILGFLLLVGGIVGGVVLTQQNQNPQEKAASCSGPSYDECRKTKGAQVCACKICGECTRPDTTPDPGVGCAPGYDCSGGAPEAGTGSTKSSCESGGGYWCDKVVENNGNAIPGFCTPQNKTCGSKAVELGYDLSGTVFDPNRNYVKSGCEGAVNLDSGCVTINTAVASFNCPNQSLSNSLNGCSENAGTSKCLSNSACGTQQIDFNFNGNSCYLSKYRACANVGNNPTAPPPIVTPVPTPVITPTPTPTPTPLLGTAQCVNVKAYSATFTQLTTQDLATLTPGTNINFCVVGSASAGSFDRARFTINGTTLAETTTQRPGSQDFCQSYTIPTGTRTFSVTAQIRHATLGWR